MIDDVRASIGTVSRQAVYDALGVFVDKHLVRRIEPAGSAAAVLPMAIRYLGEELGRGYAAGDTASDEIRIRIRPDRWFSVDCAKPTS